MRPPRLLLVHGSVVNGDATWSAQRPLAAAFELVVPNRRGFPPGPEVEAVDYEDEAEWLERFLVARTHLVGHSYGGVIALLAAARVAERVASLTVIEPPCFGVAAGDPLVEAYIRDSERIWEERADDGEAFLRAFLERVGAQVPSGELQPELLQGARTLAVERYPWTAVIPFSDLRAEPFPKLVVSGAHSDTFERTCDVLERELGAARAVLPGAGHSVQRLGDAFNELLAAFVRHAERRRRGRGS